MYVWLQLNTQTYSNHHNIHTMPKTQSIGHTWLAVAEKLALGGGSVIVPRSYIDILQTLDYPFLHKFYTFSEN